MVEGVLGGGGGERGKRTVKGVIKVTGRRAQEGKGVTGVASSRENHVR